MADSTGPTWAIPGTRSTNTPVNVAAPKVELIAASRANGATAIASTPARLRRMGNQRSNGAGINGPTEGAEQIVDGPFQGAGGMFIARKFSILWIVDRIQAKAARVRKIDGYINPADILPPASWYNTHAAL
jgi:hypothetical protein